MLLKSEHPLPMQSFDILRSLTIYHIILSVLLKSLLILFNVLVTTYLSKMLQKQYISPLPFVYHLAFFFHPLKLLWFAAFYLKTSFLSPCANTVPFPKIRFVLFLFFPPNMTFLGSLICSLCFCPDWSKFHSLEAIVFDLNCITSLKPRNERLGFG